VRDVAVRGYSHVTFTSTVRDAKTLSPSPSGPQSIRNGAERHARKSSFRIHARWRMPSSWSFAPSALPDKINTHGRG
jgi:hypothetical protein